MICRFSPLTQKWVWVRLKRLSISSKTPDLKILSSKVLNKFTNPGPIIFLNGKERDLLRILMTCSDMSPEVVELHKLIGAKEKRYE
jgi:hypothetical protein